MQSEHEGKTFGKFGLSAGEFFHDEAKDTGKLKSFYILLMRSFLLNFFRISVLRLKKCSCSGISSLTFQV